MKKQSLGLLILVVLGILIIGLVIKHNKEVFVAGTDNIALEEIK